MVHDGSVLMVENGDDKRNNGRDEINQQRLILMAEVALQWGGSLRWVDDPLEIPTNMYVGVRVCKNMHISNIYMYVCS